MEGGVLSSIREDKGGGSWNLGREGGRSDTELVSPSIPILSGRRAAAHRPQQQQ